MTTGRQTAAGTLYINGAAVGTNAALTLRPADLGATTNNWLGRSQFTGDPAFNGQIDDLRIYASALTAAQITTIYKRPVIDGAPSGRHRCQRASDVPTVRASCAGS